MMDYMPLYDASAVEKYRELLRNDPHSQVFAPLADAYREQKQLDLAEKIVRDGLRKHPQFASGYTVLGKVLKDRQNLEDALKAFKKAADLTPENVLSHQLMGDVYLELKKPREALKAYKMVLFLNPQSVKAKKITEKLESLTAVDYDDDLFEMTRLQSLEAFQGKSNPAIQEPATTVAPLETNRTKTLTRTLSLLDAYIIRNDLKKADAVLQEALDDFGPLPEINQRQKVLRSKTQSVNEEVKLNQASALAPILSREKQITRKKLETLQMLLRKIESLKASIPL